LSRRRTHLRRYDHDHMGEEYAITQCKINLHMEFNEEDVRNTGNPREVTCKHCRGSYVKQRRKELQRQLDILNRIVEKWSNDEVGLKTPKKGKQ